MGVYACLLSLLILQTVLLSALSNASSLEDGVFNQTTSSVQHHQQVLVSVRPRGGGGGSEEKRRVGPVGDWFVSMKSKGGRSGGLGGSNINHHPRQNGKNAASSLLKPASFAAKSAGLIVLVLIFF